jgi:hypothetical protein|uniref:Uncharacterized protein n=1 Tax=candidate division WOR-3 bacterium TaxID=2052148 RepID=A0A7C6A8V8_UNCW3
MNNEQERLTPRLKEYMTKYMQDLRAISKSFLNACAEKGKDSACAQLLRLRKLIERMDSNNFKAQDKKFISEAKAILLPTYEQAYKLLNQGDWFCARQLVEDAIVDTLTIESITSGWHEDATQSVS